MPQNGGLRVPEAWLHPGPPAKQSRARTSLSDLEELMLKEAAWTAKFIRRQREEEAEAGRGEKQALNWLFKRAPRTFRSSSCRGDRANIPSFDGFTAVEAAAPPTCRSALCNSSARIGRSRLRRDSGNHGVCLTCQHSAPSWRCNSPCCNAL